jgi:polar amino acid transport system permease protein
MALDPDAIAAALPNLADGLRNTLKVLAIAFPMGLVLGTACAYAMQLPSAAVKRAIRLFVDIVRNVPFLILAYLCFFGLPRLGLSLSAFTVGITIITLCSGGYFCEIMRAGFRSVPKGQTAAARSLGFSGVQVQIYVVLPQVMTFIWPTTTSLAIQMLKESAILSVIGFQELTYQSQVATAETFAYVEIFGVTAAIYWLASVMLHVAGQALEKYSLRWKRS